uniref:Uncharacterized protein n=1 Tax=Lactuca sativa TaxID=4236 RepID=A0A9R1VKB3_LACSA|nr:hypothetical protein LSAT_V11C500267170 [Lactuca sativa]
MVLELEGGQAPACPLLTPPLLGKTTRNRKWLQNLVKTPRLLLQNEPKHLLPTPTYQLPIHSILLDSSSCVEDLPPQRKRKGNKTTSTSSTENEMFDLAKQIVGINTATEIEMEQIQRYWEQKLCILEANEEYKSIYFLRPHDHLTGGILHTVHGRKRQIATLYGWELENP